MEGDVLAGMRVVRGPNWKWGEQDGGEGCVGTVVDFITLEEVESSVKLQRAVVVQWDIGNRCNYRSAIAGQYDLLLLDNDPVGCTHFGIVCDVCRDGDITGMRWKCSICPETDLCGKCYHDGRHALDHEFLRIVSPDGLRVKVTSRAGAHKIMAQGMFPQAEVVRGHDWLWGDQDGGLGKTGTLQRVRGWEKESCRSIAEVEWKETGKCNVYRIGHKGKVDLKCIKPANGGYYYAHHLPLLGAPPGCCESCDGESLRPAVESATFSPMSAQVADHHTLSPGDNVRVELEVEIFKMMQEGHGNWDDQLLDNLSDVGTVHVVLDNEDVRVKYSNSRIYTINRDALTKVTHFSAGDIVRVVDDIATVHNLQENHGGWVDDMALSLGQVGRILKVFPTGDVRVLVNSRTWTYNPQCLAYAPREELSETQSEVIEQDGEDTTSLQMKLLTMLDNPAVIVAAASSGDVGTLRNFLTKHPSQVNTEVAGKAAIHYACAQGNIDVVRCLLEFSPDIEIKDEDGDRPLHLCSYSDEDEVAQLLVAANADVNAKNNKGATPLIIAAVKGHHSVLRLLANHSSINLHEQDTDGDTALHCAVLAQKNESVNILLEAGSDPTLLNFRLFTPFHEAARIGFLSAVDHFIRRYPARVDLRKDDGFTPLHMAALNNHVDVVTSFAEHDMCDINARTDENQTALHLAVHQGNWSIVERLIGYGAQLNIQDSSGDTPLHIALAREFTAVQTSDTPQIKRVQDSIGMDVDVQTQSATIACFLVQEGADVHIQNSKGHTPLQHASPQVISLAMSYGGRSSSFHGSMKCPTSSPTAVEKPYKGGNEIAPTPRMIKKDTLPIDDSIICFLCEAQVDVKFEPCGHALMCHNCANRAKKCPTCKKQVKSISRLKEYCVMCKEEAASVTLKPCGHTYCQGCSRRLKVCFECRFAIESKIGLEPECTKAMSESSASGGVQQACAICLTEPRNTALQCGHLFCWDCAQRVDHCPVCRKFVSHRIRLFQ